MPHLTPVFYYTVVNVKSLPAKNIFICLTCTKKMVLNAVFKDFCGVQT